ncbi:MAG: type II toxin-antitoxin system VapC family toxin [Gammaproteobacteria bacterium]|nr:type II toxin-antitoxin system VapC family toxin [Gammaproteobacteria bacterium]
MTVHLDTDFLVYALSVAGPERRRLLELSDLGERVEISAVAWYEFCRGPRTPEQLATARSFFADDGVVPFSEHTAAAAAETFRRLGSPRRRAGDIAIGTTAAMRDARLISRNARDFAGIPELEVEDVVNSSGGAGPVDV